MGPCSGLVSRRLCCEPSGSWQGGTAGRALGLPLRGRVEDALDEGGFRVGEPVQPEPGPQESGGGSRRGPQIFISLIAISFCLSLSAATLGTPAKQGHGQRITCTGSGAPGGWGLGEGAHSINLLSSWPAALPFLSGKWGR